VFGNEPQKYGQSLALGLAPDCEKEVLAQLVDLVRLRDDFLTTDGISAEEAQFDAEQNARVVAHAEEYYRTMYRGGVSTWNLRDHHMADTLESVARHVERRGRSGKIIVWAHNSHVGDSAAMTHREEREETTVGHLCRARHPDDTIIIGFTTFDGSVTAASEWGGVAERKLLRPGLAFSYELLFHQTNVPRFLLILDELGEATSALHEPRLERAVGVVYRPETERWSHYFEVRLAEQMDAIIHVDRTRAIEPLERTALWDRGEMPETYPTGL
jgi:erythromycin esterase-like protein